MFGRKNNANEILSGKRKKIQSFFSSLKQKIDSLSYKAKKRLLIGSLIFVLIVMASIITGILMNINKVSTEVVAYNFKVTADKADDIGIEQDTGFVIKSKKDYALEDITKIISVEPSVAYEITKKGSGKYYLELKEMLEVNSLYNINIAENKNKPVLSWAFQTKNTYKVTGVFPANGAKVSEPKTGIELTFSKITPNIEEYFEIIPSIKGRFEQTNKKMVFEPSEELQNNTTYTIKLKKGIQSIDGDKLENDFTSSFRVEKENSDKIVFIDEYAETFTSKNPQLIELVTWEEGFADVEFNVNIYNLKTSENYLNFNKKQQENIDISKYELIDTFKSKILHKYDENGEAGSKYIALRKNLSSGWYLADITTLNGGGKFSNQHMQKLIQISDISTYIQSVNGQTIVWCNDAQNNTALTGARVSIGNKKTTTNEDGVAKIAISKETPQEIIIEAKDGRKFVGYEYLSKGENDDYLVYLYTDRETYMPTDTIRYWGVVTNKTDIVKRLGNINTYLDEQKYGKAKVNSEGYFTGEMKLNKHTSGFFDIKCRFGGIKYDVKTIYISEYVKPKYIFETKFDKEYYKNGETATLSVTGKFYGGTPATNLPVDISIDGNHTKVLLDDDGNAKVSQILQAKNDGQEYWGPNYISGSVSVTGSEEDAGDNIYAMFFPSDYAVIATRNKNGLNISTRKIDYSKYNNETKWDGERLLGEEVSGISGSVDIYKTITTKKENGSYYDFIEKVNKTDYISTVSQMFIEKVAFKTDENGNYSIEIPYTNTETEYYYLDNLVYTMPDGFIGTSSMYWETNYQENTKYYQFTTNKQNAKVNEKVNISLKGNSLNLDKGRVLYTIISDNGAEDIGIMKQDKFSVQFKTDYIPGVTIVGAYFDGENIYTVEPVYLFYNKNEKALDIDIKTDSESYAPGDKVSVTFEAKDKQGKYVETNMVISIVDEAAFVSGNQIEMPLERLYEKKYRYVEQYASYIEHILGIRTDSEGGGEGDGDRLRHDFNDTADFIAVRTDKKGRATVSFTLPDNITSWRITGVGVTDSLKAGVNTKNIVSTLPFYVTQTQNTRYNTQDDISISAKVAGTVLPLLSSKIGYTVNLLQGNKVIKTLTDTAIGSEMKNFNFGKLPAGNYYITINAQSGNYSDTIKTKLEVLDSLHELSISKNINLKDIANIEALRYPVTFDFYDENNELYYKAISKIFNTSRGSTNDQKIAYNMLVKKLKTLNGNEYLEEREVRYVQGDYGDLGGARLLYYAEPDTLLTAKLCAVAPEYIDKNAAVKYFNDIILNQDSEASEVSAAYFGLAALKEPVLNDIKYLLNNNSGFSLEDNLNLLAGLAYIGDLEGANNWYVTLFGDKLKIDDDIKYLDIKDEEERYEATATLEMILAKINHSDLSGTLNYIIKTDSKYYTPALDLVAYVSTYNPRKTEGYIKYKLDGEEKTVKFSEARGLSLGLNEEQLKSFEITDSKNTKAIATYIGNSEDLSTLYSKEIGITKSITGGNTVGDTATVTLNITFPSDARKDWYLVNDIVPSGMRLLESNDNYYEQEGQRIKFYAKNNNSTASITYKARAILPGTYAVESAIITDTNRKQNISGYSPKSSVNITG